MIFLLHFVAQVVVLHHDGALVLFFPVYTLNIAYTPLSNTSFAILAFPLLKREWP
ncbi:hypothetical protein SAMN05216286_5004 [Kosakonia oryzae]|uniref:Uncharacterized protein n=1 Tax=Kosakonia oryzae TaxID=497725 RepID=A0AA94KSX5_9ENTR|nr:hypothetical protein SAMN05216286_5004 [Kosakonia oryzae]